MDKKQLIEKMKKHADDFYIKLNPDTPTPKNFSPRYPPTTAPIIPRTIDPIIPP